MSFKEHISRLFLDIEKEVGITGLDSLVLTALCDAIHDFNEKDEADFLTQFQGLFETVRNTQPRISMVIDHFYKLCDVLLEAKSKPHPDGHLFWEKQILKTIASFRKNITSERKKMIKCASNLIQNGDVILIHSLSGSVLESLKRAKRKRKKFRVIVAEQEIEKTHKLIEYLSQAKIHFQVVPEYMLTHIEQEVTKVFLGCVTLNSNLNVVGDAGMKAVVSEFHLQKTPIYLCMLTRKFSLWHSRSTHHHYRVKNTRTHGYRPIDFERIKFSHDRIPLHLFNYIVTEDGKQTSKQIQKLYQKRFSLREQWRKQFFSSDTNDIST